MFYSQFILAKKGPLGTIWIAAHLERKLRKNQVADTNIGDSVDSILFPDVPIALRLSSHLLLGVVRIYSRKVNYLFDDCSEALLKVKQAFRSTAVDLPPEKSKAPYHSITLPETFDLDDFELPDSDIFQGNYVDHHVSSREQITLQDTLDGVTYSTSKFGLDERFGDADTSGLDLDEELLLEEVAATRDASTSVDPQAYVEPMSPQKQNELDAMASNSECMRDGADGDDVFMENAEAPHTPGLEEEPNLSHIQDTSACDHLLEPKCQHITEPDMKEDLDSISRGHEVHDGSSLQGNSSLHNDTNPETFNAANSSMMELTDTASDDPQREENPQNGIFYNEKVGVSPNAGCHEDCPKPNGMNSEESALGMTSVDLQVSENSLHSNQTSLDIHEPISSLEKINSTDLTCSQIHILRPCGAQVNQADASITNHEPLPETSREETLCGSEPSTACRGEGHSADHLEQISESNLMKIASSCQENNASCLTSNDKMEVVISDENLCSSAHDLPAPEKLLSAPGEPADLPRSVEEATPGELFKNNESDAAESNKLLSERKRSYTGSTLTEQSLNSFESSRIAHSTRMTEAIPDDDDLLSSILVGKRSSALKLKPTPAYEITSRKRPRLAPRTTGSKRKVLMDETMVLHGDTIRQQLTNTEDIRRVRKRAPCTCQEISLIQKQLLEEDIFSEPVITGVSVELICLSKQAFDLTGIKVLEIDSSSTPVENVTEKGNSVNDGNNNNIEIEITNELYGQEVTRENLTEGSNEPVELGDDGNVETVPTENKPVESYGLDLENSAAQATQFQLSENAIETGNEETSISLDGAANAAASAGIGLTCPSDGVLGDGSGKSTDLVIDSCPESRVLDAPVVTDASLVATDHAMGGEGVAVKNMSDDLLNACEFPEEITDDIADVESERRTGNGQVSEAAEVDVGAEVKTDVGYVTQMLNDDQETHLQSMFDMEESGVEVHDPKVSDYSTAVHDTEFLNVDDDDEMEAADDDDAPPDAEEIRLIDNSGWSSRTRAVAKYLQTVFTKEAEHRRNALSIDSLLVGKTRKEASRMFFESLVLKTKDYVHVEQVIPFDDITIKPCMALMKSEF